jgi:cysteine desulfurase
MQEIYLDNAAATSIDPKVIRATTLAASEAGNPSSFNEAGRRAHKLLESARADVARFLNARSSEIVFCASGSEANSLALSGVKQILTQPTEHLSVLSSAGKRVWFVPVDDVGLVNPDDIAKAITKNTTIVSIMYANNEIGTIQPIKQIAKVIRDWRKKHRAPYPYFHVDACQATPWLPMDVQALGVDLLTLNGSKVHGPRGIAVLYVRRGVQMAPQILGGSQEYGLRAGTENVPGAVGLAKALSLINKNDSEKVANLRDYFMTRLSSVLPDARVNGIVGSQRLANNINISIPGCTSEELLLELDKHGIRAGSGSACTAHSVEPSHVLKAIGTPKKYLDGVLRFSLSRDTSKADIERLIEILPLAIRRVQKISLSAR